MVAEHDIAMFEYYYSNIIQETINMIHCYLIKYWVQLKEELKYAFLHIKSRVYVYTRSYLEAICWDQLQCGNISLNGYILTDDNISHIFINKGALGENS
jgi:hypothetical protein